MAFKISRLMRFAREDRGSATILSLYFTLIIIVIGGMSVDFNKVMANRTELQIAADTAAHAALYTRETNTREEAITVGMDTVAGMFPEFSGDTALVSSDFEFGEWDFDTQSFVLDSSSKSAVRVTTEMSDVRGNAVRNLLLRIIGFDTFDVSTSAVYTTYLPACFREGFVADDVVDIQSNNSYFNGFCLHSNTYVKLSSNNFFQEGTIVSMPNLDDLELPNSGFDTNEGLQAALRQGDYRLRLLRKLPAVISGLSAGDMGPMRDLESQFLPAGFVSGSPTALNGGGGGGKKLSPADFNLGARIYSRNCGGKGSVTLETGHYENLVFVSNCDVKIGNGATFENVIIATTSTDVRSVNASGVRLGADDSCNPGGGVLILTLGGFYAASGLEVYGTQILAHKDIQFAAQADGVQGVSFQTYGRIDGTSNMNMGYCAGSGTEDFLTANYFRMVN